MTNLKEIKDFFDRYDYPKETLILSKGEKIIGLKLFVKSHILYLESNKKKQFMPYFNRLKKVYLKLKQ